ncbi:uncharacterized protein SPPG_01792 [Spizellomyces punctatus DAOM BR117]|uniref:Methyltransferase-like protein 22 n=1 Tax=Spizellomyces punctatus (strain DAOM BR117) TaxID=645134 RepID=A0A0L0HPI7_SPIPD|nr:uncharacterized protein SPPG_01792 [Spizellomyces punctatus DAOM BR117]KND02709.1 hypothetical protein SPPG_01792 [Spizellomyces punctatus DAOM BR117]|eukprot:XP_016610748.1 hypothetical protein SPPG_01792 [Spizellomyces punctatus DAOM BR117]
MKRSHAHEQNHVFENVSDPGTDREDKLQGKRQRRLSSLQDEKQGGTGIPCDGVNTVDPPADDELVDLVLSEVHINPLNGPAQNDGQNRRRTVFRLKPESRMSGTSPLIIEHEMATPLSRVGLQVWSGALLLCDYILSQSDNIFTPETIVLELGCGTGLVAAVAGRACGRVYATDLDSLGVLDLCCRNLELNDVKDRVKVKQLDLLDNQCPLFKEFDTSNDIDRAPILNAVDSGPYCWTSADVQDFMANCTILLAADIIYEDTVTFALVQRLWTLLSPTTNNQPRILYLALEKRVQFSLDEQEVTAPARDYFLETLKASNADRGEANVPERIVAKMMDIDRIPHILQYERTKELELWSLTLERIESEG